jgi:hypothetical protein
MTSQSMLALTHLVIVSSPDGKPYPGSLEYVVVNESEAHLVVIENKQTTEYMAQGIVDEHQPGPHPDASYAFCQNIV